MTAVARGYLPHSFYKASNLLYICFLIILIPLSELVLNGSIERCFPFQYGETIWINLISLECIISYFPPYGCQFSYIGLLNPLENCFPIFLDAALTAWKIFLRNILGNIEKVPLKRLFSPLMDVSSLV